LMPKCVLGPSCGRLSPRPNPPPRTAAPQSARPRSGAARHRVDCGSVALVDAQAARRWQAGVKTFVQPGCGAPSRCNCATPHIFPDERRRRPRPFT
jgi:hypothetical protein